ncbi:hypothetical protein [Lysobacter sp. 22409]|uniref:hypothetical protein n=1 Tax=Lysobacter sp. 22409 TaxID=3453917 RepID=UPI003F86CA45
MRQWAFDQGQGVLLCCSSTRHRRFIDDLVSIMALPNGSRVRLRYGDDVCDPEVRRLGEVCEEVPKGTIALIAHVRFEEKDGQAKFLPLRIGEVVELRTEGSATFLEIGLRDFVEQPQGTEFVQSLLPLAALALPHKSPGAHKPIGYFCQRLKAGPALIRSSNTLCWERIATNFLAAIDGSNADFPFLFHIEVIRRRRHRLVPLRNGMLIAPAVAELEIHVRTLADKSSYGSIIQTPIGCLELRVDHPECRLSSGTRLPIDTTRNLLIARMATSVSLRPAYGAIVVTARRSDELATTTPAAPAEAPNTEGAAPPAAVPLKPVDQVIVELPILVGRPASRLLAAGLIALAVAAHAFDVDQFTEHKELVLLKAGLILIAALIALLLGMKPQGG